MLSEPHLGDLLEKTSSMLHHSLRKCWNYNLIFVVFHHLAKATVWRVVKGLKWRQWIIIRRMKQHGPVKTETSNHKNKISRKKLELNMSAERLLCGKWREFSVNFWNLPKVWMKNVFWWNQNWPFGFDTNNIIPKQSDYPTVKHRGGGVMLWC